MSVPSDGRSGKKQTKMLLRRNSFPPSVLFIISPSTITFPVKVQERRAVVCVVSPTFTFLTQTNENKFHLSFFLPPAILFSLLRNGGRKFRKRGATSTSWCFTRVTANERAKGLNVTCTWKSRGKVVLCQDSFPCVSSARPLHFSSYYSALSLVWSVLNPAFDSGSFSPPMYHYSSAARSRFREWHPSNRKVS